MILYRIFARVKDYIKTRNKLKTDRKKDASNLKLYSNGCIIIGLNLSMNVGYCSHILGTLFMFALTFLSIIQDVLHILKKHHVKLKSYSSKHVIFSWWYRNLSRHVSIRTIFHLRYFYVTTDLVNEESFFSGKNSTYFATQKCCFAVYDPFIYGL